MISQEKIEQLRKERAKLNNPIDRIVFDNQWIDGMPVGLLLLYNSEKK